jgi:hypothetical protein
VFFWKGSLKNQVDHESCVWMMTTKKTYAQATFSYWMWSTAHNWHYDIKIYPNALSMTLTSMGKKYEINKIILEMKEDGVTRWN